MLMLSYFKIEEDQGFLITFDVEYEKINKRNSNTYDAYDRHIPQDPPVRIHWIVMQYRIRD